MRLFISALDFEERTSRAQFLGKMFIKSVLLATCLVVIVFANDVPLNKGNVASHLSRIQRSPQQPNVGEFPNFVPPSFDNSQIVSQQTDRNKNGYAQTTIYRGENGYGASSVSVSKSGATSAAMSFRFLLILAILPIINILRK
ncbi:uncharacterized protein LOC129768855 [Toxorhynchites rutilus septentrionalis]|uniref:uncharacterized protein LOC129768855 n=1 Tax=Toxorhynchites rutilus septentrionalis TaxID=329112 RepID=UPI002479A4EA|nr:uncharacterized protein LOC129768855 [Toxorhynchites rutilus septentrionalis]